LENRRSGRSLSPGRFVGTVVDIAGRLIELAPDKINFPTDISLNTGFLTNGEGIIKTEKVELSTADIKKQFSDLSKQITSSSEDFTRTISRTTDTIALYMPDTVAFTHNQAYTDLSLTGGAAAVFEAGQSIVDSIRDGKLTFNKSDLGSSINAIAKSLSPFIARGLIGSFLGPDVGRAILATTTGKVVNPLLDLLYTSPEFRNFRFDFMFYPREQNEALEVQKLINRLYFHQAPEVEDTGIGYFLVPPSEFDIKFYYNGKVNENIPQISTCVLTSIDVDYAPNGYATYEVPGIVKPQLGGTGMPVAIRLSLNFKETEIITKSFYNDRAIRALDTTNYGGSV